MSAHPALIEPVVHQCYGSICAFRGSRGGLGLVPAHEPHCSIGHSFTGVCLTGHTSYPSNVSPLTLHRRAQARVSERVRGPKPRVPAFTAAYIEDDEDEPDYYAGSRAAGGGVDDYYRRRGDDEEVRLGGFVQVV